MSSKSILKSRTFWANALVGGLAAADHVVGSGVLGPQTTAVAIPALAALNIFLRTLSTQPVKLR